MMGRIRWEAVLAMVLSVALVLAVFGLRIANPFDTSWIDVDAVTAQFAWEQYRIDPHHFYPVESDRYSYPLAMPLAMFDVMPLVALVVKAITPAAIGQFQYFGPLFLLGVALQALFAWLLLRELTPKGSGTAYRVALLVGTLFFATAPILLVRFQLAHMSLTHQWLLIASLWLVARSNRIGLRGTVRGFVILEFVAASINVYLMIMTLMFYCGLILQFLIKKSIRLSDIMPIFYPIVSALIALIISSFINPFGGALVPGEGYGFFSANTNALFNPMPKYFGSALLPELGVASGGQYEGFGYMGLGALLLMLGGAVLARIRGDDGDGVFPPLAVVAFFAFLLSLSARLTFGIYSFDLTLPQSLFDLLLIFRSSGRFIWVVIYALLFIAIASLIRQLKPGRAAAILVLAALVQMVDIAGPLAGMQQRFARINGSARFTESAFANLGQRHDMLVVLPAWQCQLWNSGKFDYPWETFIQFSNLATDNRLRTNSFYGGRTPMAQVQYHCTDYPQALLKGPAAPRTAYLLSKDGFSRYGAHIAATHLCDFADGMFLCRGDKGQVGITARAGLAREANLVPANQAENAP